MATIKQHDFIEIEYTGTIKDTNRIFDTTNAEAAKRNNVFSEDAEYKPIIVCVGENQIVKGIDNFLIGKEAGKEYSIELSPENAFGKKDASLIQLIPTKKFLQQNINPMAGLQVNIDGLIGTIKSVSGGRTLMDFNHPLSGREISYTVKVNRILSDEKEKIAGFLKAWLNLKEEDIKVEVNDGKAFLHSKQPLPENIKEGISKKLKEIIPSLADVVFTAEEKKK